jgi:hypothetical protein
MAESRVPGGDAVLTTEEESVKAVGRFRTALPQVWVEDMFNWTCASYNFITMNINISAITPLSYVFI